MLLRTVWNHVTNFMKIKASWLLGFWSGGCCWCRAMLGRRTRRKSLGWSLLGGNSNSGLGVELPLTTQHGILHVGKNRPSWSLCNEEILAERGKFGSLKPQGFQDVKLSARGRTRNGRWAEVKDEILYHYQKLRGWSNPLHEPAISGEFVTSAVGMTGIKEKENRINVSIKNQNKKRILIAQIRNLVITTLLKRFT